MKEGKVMIDKPINDDKTIAGGGIGTMLVGRYHILCQLGEGGMGSDVSFSLSSYNDNESLALFQFPQTHERIDLFTRVCKQIVGSYRKRGIRIKEDGQR